MSAPACRLVGQASTEFLVVSVLVGVVLVAGVADGELGRLLAALSERFAHFTSSLSRP